MAQRQIDSAELKINNDTVGYVPNSLEADLGNPTRTKTPVITGVGSISYVDNTDFSSQVASVTVSLYNTVENKRLVKQIEANGHNNTISIGYPDGSTENYIGAAIGDRVTRNIGNEGTIDITFTAATPTGDQ